MYLNVVAWFYRTPPDLALEIFRSSRKVAGFGGVDRFANPTQSWDCLTLDLMKVWAAFTKRSEKHWVAEIQMRGRWDDMYPAFQALFADFLSQQHQMAELIGSARNPEPYPFLTHSFHRDSCPPITVNCDEEEERVIKPGEWDYWLEYGPELHFIHQDVFDRAGVKAIELGDRLNAPILPMTRGTLLDCGWTQEFELPEAVADLRRRGERALRHATGGTLRTG